MPRTPRTTININHPNVENLEFTANQVNNWIEDPASEKDLQTKIEHALDEAQADIMNGSTETQYIVIKVTK